jgi:hypothetical protein
MNNTFSAYINPLRCFQIEGIPGQDKVAADFRDIASYMVAQGHSSSLEDISGRYEKIAKYARKLFVAPADAPYILDKLIWPLRHAVSSYMLSNYLGVIAQCGYVAEMVAILWMEMGNFQVNGKEMDTKRHEKIFGRPYEKLGQEQRVNILYGYELISPEVYKNFERIREIRRKYLHLLTSSHDRIEEDALIIFEATVNNVMSVLGITLVDSRVAFSPLFNQWLTRNRLGADSSKNVP